MDLSPPAKAPKSQLAVEQPQTGGRWNLPMTSSGGGRRPLPHWAPRLLPRPGFLTGDHHEEDQTGRYRDRLETQQETGVGVSEREAGDY